MPLLHRDGARIEVLHAVEDFKQRRFACTIGADNADAVAGYNQPIEVVEEHSVAVAHLGCGNLNHISFSLSRWRGAAIARVGFWATDPLT